MAQNTIDIAIIGGGASGLVAAISAKRHNPDLRVTIFESNQRVGKKLLTTGNGRCNLGNYGSFEGKYHGDVDFAMNVLNRFGTSDTIDFFTGIGVECVELEEGKLFPSCLQAGGVVDQLRFMAEDLCAEILIENPVEDLSFKNGLFMIKTPQNTFAARRVIVSVGGAAAPKSGSDGKGYSLLTKFGHKKTSIHPAIVQVITDNAPIKGLSGIKVEGKISCRTGQETRVEYGEILFTDYGLSGPPVLQISGMISRNGGGEITLDFIPERTFGEILEVLKRRKSIFKNRTAQHLLLGFMNKRLGETVIKRAGISLQTPISELSEGNLKEITSKIKKFQLNAKGTKGFDAAQVTAGGISTQHFNPETLESTLQKGLYAVGEVLNVDGDCGGFNLQWAWSTGYIAGGAASEF